MKIELYIHCRPCMEKVVVDPNGKMDDARMVFVEEITFDDSIIEKYKCANCNHEIEIEVGVSAA